MNDLYDMINIHVGQVLGIVGLSRSWTLRIWMTHECRVDIYHAKLFLNIFICVFTTLFVNYGMINLCNLFCANFSPTFPFTETKLWGFFSRKEPYLVVSS